MIYSDNAPELEKHLHKTFDSKRMNLVNFRKEYFKVSIEDVVNAVKEKSSTVEFTMKAEAEEYRKTQAIIAENSNASKEKPTEELYDEILGI